MPISFQAHITHVTPIAQMKQNLRKPNKYLTTAIVAIAAIATAIVVCYAVVSANASGKTFNCIDDVPHNEVGLLLGTSPITPRGIHNYYFDNRIKATADLYHAGKIDRVIASGGDYSSRSNGCNELAAMRDSLVARGVPDSVIMLDYHGTRTIYSIINAKRTYHLDSLTIISQQYHNERAIYLAEHHGLHPVAYNAHTPARRITRIRNFAREFLARVKMFIELCIS